MLSGYRVDRLGPLARDEFAGLDSHQLLAGVSSWVGTNNRYVTGSSRPDAVGERRVARERVCRVFAHLPVAQLCANGVLTRWHRCTRQGSSPSTFTPRCGDRRGRA